METLIKDTLNKRHLCIKENLCPLYPNVSSVRGMLGLLLIVRGIMRWMWRCTTLYGIMQSVEREKGADLG